MKSRGDIHNSYHDDKRNTSESHCCKNKTISIPETKNHRVVFKNLNYLKIKTNCWFV